MYCTLCMIFLLSYYGNKTGLQLSSQNSLFTIDKSAVFHDFGVV